MMSDEPQLFDNGGKVIAFARRTNPETSRLAAEEVTPHVRQLQFAVLEYAGTVRGFTDPDLNQHFGVTSSTYRTRRAELVDLGLIADTGERRCLGTGGRKHCVWTISSKGRELLAHRQRSAA
jgi:hypothetical protein